MIILYIYTVLKNMFHSPMTIIATGRAAKIRTQIIQATAKKYNIIVIVAKCKRITMRMTKGTV